MDKLFCELFEYNFHVNQEVSDRIFSNPNSVVGKSKKLYNHILNAHHIWNSRIMGRQPGYEVWGLQPDDLLKEININNFNDTLHLIKEIDLDSVIRYQNSKGQWFENESRDILFHIINHSTYHRGQIAMDFRLNGLEPINTDYIFYKR